MIQILIPSYGRPSQAMNVVENLLDVSVVDVKAYVIVEPEQYDAYDQERLARHHAYTPILLENTRTKNYAGAINTALEQINDGPFVFFAADDVKFHPQWDAEALRVMRALNHIKVVGTNDLLNEYVLKGWHATHYLVSRDYLHDPGGVVDGGMGHALFEGYSHNYTDTEFIGTAKARAVFAPCLESVVEHLHWQVGKSPKDSTSEKAYADYDEDTRLYLARKDLWWGLSR